MKILHVLNTLMPSGAEVMLKRAYPYWDEMEHCILESGKESGPYSSVLKESGYRIEKLEAENKIQVLLQFYKFLSQENQKFDVVHIHRESMSQYFALIAKICKIKGICRTVHSNFDFSGLLRFRRIITRFFMRKLGVAFIGISDSVAETEKKVLWNPCRFLVYNWYDHQQYSYTDESEKQRCREVLGLKDGFYLISVGNCSKVKNHAAILEAMAELKDFPDLYYLHIGKEIDKHERESAEYYGLSERVVFAGYVDPLVYLKAADIYIMPSLYEGLGIAALEAAGIGLPLLLANVKGLSDLKKFCLDNTNYFELNTGELKTRIEEMYQRKKAGRLKNSVKQSQMLVQNYSVQRGVEAYKKIYQQLLKVNV